MKKIIKFYIFGNQLKENFAFNYKIIIINLLFKIFFQYLLYIMSLTIYMFSVFYMSRVSLPGW